MKANSIIALFLVAGLAVVSLGAGSSSKSVRRKATPRHVILYNQGVAAQKQGDHQKAASLFGKAVELKPRFPDGWNNLGFSLRKISAAYNERALAAYGKALKFNPNHEQALEYLGELHLLRGEFGKAVGMYERLRRLKSKEAGALKKKIDRILREAKTTG